MAIINEIGEDKPRKEVVVSVQPQSEGEESEAEEDYEENNEQGTKKIRYIMLFFYSFFVKEFSMTIPLILR